MDHGVQVQLLHYYAGLLKQTLGFSLNILHASGEADSKEDRQNILILRFNM